MTTTGPRTIPPADVLKCSCATVWAHPVARLLFGDALRPGGRELTADLVDRCRLAPSDRVLDVGSGTGVTLSLLRERGMRAVGVDYSAALAGVATASGAVTVGDAELVPFAIGAFDAVVIECVLSALPDKAAAVDEMRRVLQPGGRLAMSDVLVTGPLPDPLDSLLGWMACTAGALGSTGYQDLLEAHGFEVLEINEHPGAVRALVAKARRRVALLQAAARVGVVPGPEELIGADLSTIVGAVGGSGDLDALAQRVLAQAAAAVDNGVLGYTSLVARAN